MGPWEARSNNQINTNRPIYLNVTNVWKQPEKKKSGGTEIPAKLDYNLNQVLPAKSMVAISGIFTAEKVSKWEISNGDCSLKLPADLKFNDT